MNDTLSETAPAQAATAAKQLPRFVSLYKNVRTVRSSTQHTAGELLDDIRSTRWKKEVEAVRAAYRTDKATGDKLKAKLPAIAWSGMFEHRRNNSLLTHSGLLCLDFDKLGDRLAYARRLLVADPHVLAIFLSPSGTGLKVIVPIAARDADTHRACFLSAEAHFKKLDLTADPTGKDVARLCFVSFDADAWTSTGAGVPFFGSVASSLLTTPTPIPTPELCTLHTTLYTTEGDDRVLLARVRAEAQRYLEKIKVDAPFLVSLYGHVLADRFDLGLHCRNQWLTAAVPFLFVAFSRRVGLELVLLHLRAYSGLYQGDETEHRASFDSLWTGCEKSYPADLSAIEREIFEALNEPEKSAFRICRDLARRDTSLKFFLACDHLALRLAPPGEVNGWRLLRTFEKLCIVSLVAKGHPRAQGQRSLASSYRWALPVLDPSTAAA